MSLTSNIYIRLNDDIINDIQISEFELNFALTDIKNLNAAKTAFSIPISLPYTPKIVSIFGSLFNINNTSEITQEKISAKLIYENRVVIDGYLYIDKMDMDSIDIIIARGDLTIFEDIAGLYLPDLLLTGATYLYNNKSFLDYYKDMTGYTYAADTCDTGHTHKFVAIDYFGVGNTLTYYKGYNLNALFNFKYRLAPVLRAKIIFDAIMSQNNYTYTMSSAVQDKLEKLYMSTNCPIENYTIDAYSYIFFAYDLFTDDVGSNPTNNIYLNPYEYQLATKSYNVQSTEDNWDPYPHNWGLRAMYPFSLANTEYQFNFSVGALNSSPGQSTSVKFYLHRAFPIGSIYDADPENEKEIEIGSITVTGTSIWDYYTSEVRYTPTIDEIYSKTKTGNTYGFFFQSYYIRVEKETTTSIFGTFLNLKCPNWLYDVTNQYTLNSLLPAAYKQSDFLNDILTMFNVYVFVDNDNKKHINFLTYDDFYSDDALDWSNKLSIDKIQITDLTKELTGKYTLGFKAGDDLINKSYLDKNKKRINQQDVYNDNQLSKNETSEITVSVPQNIFTTEMRTDSKWSMGYFGIASNYTNETSKISYGFINKFAFGDFIVAYEYMKINDETTYSYNQYQPNFFALDYYLTFSPFLLTGITLNDISGAGTFALQFNTEDQYLMNYNFDTHITNKNLYTDFWQTDIESKNSGNQKLLKAKMKLYPNDLNILNFQKRIWIDNDKLGASYYRINKIVFPSDSSILSNVELISITNYTPTHTDLVYINKINWNPLTDAIGSYGGSNTSSNQYVAGVGTTGGSVSGATSLSGLTDVNIQFPEENDILTFRSSKWINSDSIKTKAVYGNSGATSILYLAPDNNKVYVGDGTFTALEAPDRQLNVNGGIYSDGNLQFPGGRTIYMGTTSDVGSRFNWKQVTGGVDDGAYQDYYPKLTYRTGAAASNINTMRLTATGDIEIFNDVKFSGNTTHEETLGSPTFFSGFVGSGWRLDGYPSDSNLTLDNLTVRKQMKVFELQIQKISSVNGGLIISAANGKAYAVAANKIYFDENGIKNQIQFAIGDYIRAQMWLSDGIQYYLGRVTGVHHSATLGSAYIDVTDISNTCWEGAELVQVGSDTQAGRRNIIYITAAPDDAYNPYIDFMAGCSDGTFNQAGVHKIRLGNLSGITDLNFNGGAPLSGYGLYATGSVYISGIMQIAPGSTGFTNLTDLPGTLLAPAGTGLFLSSNYMGFYDSGAFRTFMANNGDFGLGDTTGAGPGMFWDNSAGSLTIKGSITITNSIPYASISSTPSSLGDINSTEGSKLTGIAAGATVGADWNSNVSNKPTLGSLAALNSIQYTSAQLTDKPTLGTLAALNGAPWNTLTGPPNYTLAASGKGLFMNDSYFGFYNATDFPSDPWRSFISSNGDARFVGVTEFGTAAVAGPWSSAQQIALKGNDMWENAATTSDANISINRFGKGGASGTTVTIDGFTYTNYSRNFYIYGDYGAKFGIPRVQIEQVATFNIPVSILNQAGFGSVSDTDIRQFAYSGQIIRPYYIATGANSHTISRKYGDASTSASLIILQTNCSENQAIYLPAAAGGEYTPDRGTEIVFINQSAARTYTIIGRRTDMGPYGYYINNVGSLVDSVTIGVYRSYSVIFGGQYWCDSGGYR